MEYKNFKGKQLSTLGLGCMRLPIVGGDNGHVDEEGAREIIEYAYAQGINYFDTAFVYHGGASERILGKVMSQYPRDSWFLADKFLASAVRPGWSIADYFEEQLARLGTDYIDFYLIHNVSDQTIGDYLKLDETQHMMEYFTGLKQAGRIRHLGFSCHSSTENMERFLDFYDFDFVQLQLNYADWTMQDAKRKYEILTERGIPVIVMEPCRGGRLASLGGENDAQLKALRPDQSVAAWAFNFLQSLPNVLVTLSGMSNMDQLKDNIATFASPKPLQPQETELIMRMVAPLLSQVPCTSCRYCVPDCPQGLDIPRLLEIYNEHLFAPGPNIFWSTDDMPPEALPSACIACGACVKSCPQAIDIPDIMRKFSDHLRGG